MRIPTVATAPSRLLLLAVATMTFGLAAAAGVHAADPAPAAPAAPPAKASPAPGDVIPSFDTLTVDGTPKSVSFKKGPTILLFFSPSCPHCHKMIPKWNQAYNCLLYTSPSPRDS